MTLRCGQGSLRGAGRAGFGGDPSIRKIVVRVMPVIWWMRWRLIPAASAVRITSSRSACVRAHARSCVSAASGECVGPRRAGISGAAWRRTREAARGAGRGCGSRSGSCRNAMGGTGRGAGARAAAGWPARHRKVRAIGSALPFLALHWPAGSYPCPVSQMVISRCALWRDGESTPTPIAVPSWRTIRQVISRCGWLSQTSMGLFFVSTVVTFWVFVGSGAVVACGR